MSVNLTALAQSIAAALKRQTGVSVPSSVILAHFQAEGTTGGNNYAGLMQNGKLISFPSQSAFAAEYVNTVAPHLTGAINQGYVTPGSTLTQQQYAQALQLGTAHPYCGSNCGNFYDVPKPSGVSQSTWLSQVVNLLGNSSRGPYGPTIHGPGGSNPNASGNASAGSMPWWQTGIILAAILGLVLVVVGKTVGGVDPVRIVTGAAKAAVS